MTVTKTREGNTLTVALEGRLDTLTAPELETELNGEEADTLVFDLAKLDYISSAGLRLLLSSQKKANATGGTMIVRNCQPAVLDVFEVTGFMDVLTVE